MADKDYQDSFRLYAEHAGVTVQEHEEIFDNVFAATRRAERKGFSVVVHHPVFRWAAISLALVGVLAIGGWMATEFSSATTGRKMGTFTPRGTASVGGVTLICTGTQNPGMCHRSDTMTFRVTPSGTRQYFSAFSRHQKSGAVVWYFPATENERSLRLSSSGDTILLEEGITIGEEHAPGTYELISIFSDNPLSAADIRGLFNEQGEFDSHNADIVKSMFNIEG